MNWKKHARPILIRTGAVAIGFGLGLQAPIAQQVDPSTAPVPDIGDAASDTRRALVVEIAVDSGDGASVVDLVISDVPPAVQDAPPLFLVEAFNSEGELLSSRNAWDPRWEFVETEDGGERRDLLTEAVGAFDIVFDHRIAEVRITDQNSHRPDLEPVPLLTQDVSATVQQFCIDNPDDSNCADFSLNEPPVAEAGGPYSVRPGDTLGATLNGTGSSDPDGDPLTFTWDFNGDGVFGESTEYGDEWRSQPKFTAPEIAKEGFVDIILRVCDTSDECDEDDAQVKIDDGDDLLASADVCPNTQFPEVAPTSGELKPNRWALASGSKFVQAPPQSGERHQFAIADTAGCSCAQIVEATGSGGSHLRDGCSTSLLLGWIEAQ